MEDKMRKYRQTSPDRAKVWTEPSPKNHCRRVPVVYYLSRNHHLEHPHFIEVPLSSSEGLYLRDVISRLNALRGRGMPAMYSWSCKRSYKNGFVWHDLCEDDLILPAHGSEYVLKGSEIFEQSHSDHLYTKSNVKLQKPKQLQEPTFSRSQEASSQEDEVSPPLQRPKSSSVSPESRVGKNAPWGSSTSLTNYKVCRGDGGANASTQTDECGVPETKSRETCTRGVSTDDGSLEFECSGHHQIQIKPVKENSELCREEVSPPPSSSSTSSGGKNETLESLIRADVNKMNSFRILEEEDIRMLPNSKIKPSNVLMQLISCGSISVKDHSFGLIPTYRPRFSHSKFHSPLYSASMMMGELECLSENPRMLGLRVEDKEYFSGSLIETKTNKGGEGFPVLKRSSSYNADRTCKASDSTGDNEPVDTARSKCIPRSIKASLCKNPRSESMRSPVSSDAPRNSSAAGEGSDPASLCVSNASSKRITEPSSSKKLSKRKESFREDKNKVVKIEERLASGARIIIQSKAPCEDSDGSL